MNSQRFLIPIISSLVATAAHAGPRTSANYTIATDAADAGGKRATSVSYTNDGSAGLLAGISTVAAPAETAKSGYIGQLYDIIGFVLSASPTTVNEGGTLHLKPGTSSERPTITKRLLLKSEGGPVTIGQ